MDARLDTLSTELHQVNVRVGRIARLQATMGGFALKPTPLPPHPVASNSDAADDDDDGDDLCFASILTTTPLQSLRLDFCYLFLSILL